MKQEPAKVTIWTDTTRAGRDGQIVDAMGALVQVAAVGGPRTAEVATLAKRFGCAPYDDLRKMLVDVPTPWLLLGSLDNARAKDLTSAINAGTQILVIEPLSTSPDANAPLAADPSRGRVWQVPSFLRTEGWTSAAEPLSVLEVAQMISFTSLGRVDDCSLLARLADAWRVILQIGRLPLSIDASLVGPLAAPPEDLRGITGHLAAHARLPDGSAVLVQVSDRAGTHERRLDIVGRGGRLHAGDLDYQLYDGSGNLMDQRDGEGGVIDFVNRAAADWRRLLSGMDRATESTEKQDRALELERDAMACCLTCLLSARTGESERPERMLQMR